MPYPDIIPWIPKIHYVLDTEAPYFGGTAIPSLKAVELHQRDFIHIKVKNEPKIRGKNSEAKKVFAKVTFYDLRYNTILLEERFGRWAETPQPPQVSNPEKLKYIDIPAGDEKTLDIATKYLIHDDWYAFDTESYTAEHFEAEYNKLNSNGFKFKVVISAQGIEETTKWYAVKNGDDGKPKIIEITPAF